MSSSSQEKITRFSDLEGPYEPSTSFGRASGCRISVVWGFALVLLAAILAVVVGIIVYFAAPPREIKCELGSNNGGEGAPSWIPSSEALWLQCETLAEQRTDKCKLAELHVSCGNLYQIRITRLNKRITQHNIIFNEYI